VTECPEGGEDYVYLVPFVEDESTVFLKTIIPSRKATKPFLVEESDDVRTQDRRVRRPHFHEADT